MNQKVNKFAPLLMLVLVHSFCVVNVCTAAPNEKKTGEPQEAKPGEPQGTRPKKPGEFYKRSATEFKANSLTQAPNLRELPLYTGSSVEFGWGEEFPNASGGKVIAYNFSTADPQNRVLQWYQQLLSARGWTVEMIPADNEDDTGALTAKKDHGICQISTQSAGNNRTSVRVHFHGASS